MTTPPQNSGPRHGWLYAVRGGHMPEMFECGGRTYAHISTFKHDFFAATGLYACGDDRVVLKLGRQSCLGFVPLRWIGRLLTRREAAHYRRVADLPCVPAFVGTVLNDTGLVHAFVPGRPLGDREAVSDTFFTELAELLNTLHGRGLAYVDLNKRQNILLGDDGRAYLIDFQISVFVSPRLQRWAPPLAWLLARFQQADLYHLAKHKRRCRPDLLSAEDRARLERLSIWIRLHRLVARPLTNLRRALLRRLKRGDDYRVPGAEAK